LKTPNAFAAVPWGQKSLSSGKSMSPQSFAKATWENCESQLMPRTWASSSANLPAYACRMGSSRLQTGVQSKG